MFNTNDNNNITVIRIIRNNIVTMIEFICRLLIRYFSHANVLVTVKSKIKHDKI